MQEPSSLYRIEVAPLVILPMDRSPLFSYASREDLPLGSLVSISFGSRQIEGIVYASQALPGPRPSWMKEVTSIKTPAFLTEEQRKLASFVSQEYFTPLGKVLKHFTPKTVKKRVSEKTTPSPTLTPLRAKKEEAALLKKFATKATKAPLFLDTTFLTEPEHFLFLLAKQGATKKNQTLIILPEIVLLSDWERVAREYFPEEKLAVLHSQLSDGAYFEAWEKIRSGEASVILTTRQGLFAPFKNLGLVVLAEEQDESYKQWDMSPRYHAKKVVKALADFTKAPLLFMTATPSSDLMLSLKEKTCLPLIPAKEKPPLGKNLLLVNLKLERFRKNYSPLSEALVDHLRSTLAAKKQAILYIHRQGMSSLSICESCKNIFRCPKSGHPLTNTREGYFRCLGCPYKTPLFPSCPHCNHLQFRHVGFGTERIEKEVAKLFPHARIFRADSSTMKKAGTLSQLTQKAHQGEIDIIIGTQMILKAPRLPSLGLIAMIDADSLLSWPDFQADERFYQYLEQAIFRTKTEGEKNGNVLVQTFQTESAFFQRTNSLSESAFYDHTLSEREALFYPPYSRFLSLSAQQVKKEVLVKDMQALSETLEALSKKQPGMRVGLPEEPRLLKRPVTFESSLLLRLPYDARISPEVLSALNKAAKTCLIDVDPISFH